MEPLNKKLMDIQHLFECKTDTIWVAGGRICQKVKKDGYVRFVQNYQPNFWEVLVL